MFQPAIQVKCGYLEMGTAKIAPTLNNVILMEETVA